MVLYGVRIKLPTFIYLLFRLFTAQAFIRRKDYISEFPYILTTLYENVDGQVTCCTITSVLSGTVAVGKVVSDKIGHLQDLFWVLES